MVKLMEWSTSPEVKVVLVVCCLISVLDFSLRVLPEASDGNNLAGVERISVLERLLPSKQWMDWYEQIKLTAEIEAKKIEEAKLAAAAQVEPKRTAPIKDEQRGDLARFRVGELTYQLWGVFNKAGGSLGDDVFGVLKSKDGTEQVRTGDIIGKYKVTSIDSRSVIFKSTVDDRVVTLWLFGKGPR